MLFTYEHHGRVYEVAAATRAEADTKAERMARVIDSNHDLFGRPQENANGDQVQD